jgi:hypothetical protein
MVQVITHRGHLEAFFENARVDEARRKLVVFGAPAIERIIIPVDSNKVFLPESKVTAFGIGGFLFGHPEDEREEGDTQGIDPAADADAEKMQRAAVTV